MTFKIKYQEFNSRSVQVNSQHIVTSIFKDIFDKIETFQKKFGSENVTCISSWTASGKKTLKEIVYYVDS